MSIILEKPATSEARTLTISVPMTITRAMVVVAVDEASADKQVHPDALTPECVREALLVLLRVRGELALEDDGTFLDRTPDDPEDRPFWDAMYRAADRAFPELAPEVTA